MQIGGFYDVFLLDRFFQTVETAIGTINGTFILLQIF